ncbi:hypothetical protein SDC9_157137 [bioreactor metagenome]|uniref:Uncharacterized protein n=1 Tax=bioreactor metagenome TaxID=1076179 RepID=A0A645F664_9ZZZZ
MDICHTDICHKGICREDIYHHYTYKAAYMAAGRTAPMGKRNTTDFVSYFYTSSYVLYVNVEKSVNVIIAVSPTSIMNCVF